MKKLLALILAALLLCGIITPAFAEDAEPDKPELVAAEIVSIPEKNQVVYTGGAPEAPDGIVVKLTFSDGSELTDTIIKEENGSFSVAGIPVLDLDMRPGGNRYGEQEATLYFGSDSVSATYNYKSNKEPETISRLYLFFHDFPAWLEGVSIEMYLFRERILNCFYQLLRLLRD